MSLFAPRTARGSLPRDASDHRHLSPPRGSYPPPSNPTRLPPPWIPHHSLVGTGIVRNSRIALSLQAPCLQVPAAIYSHLAAHHLTQKTKPAFRSDPRLRMRQVQALCPLLQLSACPPSAHVPRCAACLLAQPSDAEGRSVLCSTLIPLAAPTNILSIASMQMRFTIDRPR